MGKVVRSALNNEQAIARTLSGLAREIDKLRGRRGTIPVISGTGAPFTLGDTDGSWWIDRDDNSVHFIVNGAEFMFKGTAV